MNPYLSPADGASSPHPQPFPAGMNRQKGKKHNHQKNYNANQAFPQHGQGQRRSQGQSCYNCGSPEHWAQHCPEPKRPIPVGSASHSHPQKRRKTIPGPPGPQYGMPAGYQPPLEDPHRGYTHPAAVYPGYPPVPAPHGPHGSHGPPTPLSAHSPPFNQWDSRSPHHYPPGHYPSYVGHAHAPPTPASAYHGWFPTPESPNGFPPRQPIPSRDRFNRPFYPSLPSHDYGQPAELSTSRQQPWRRPSRDHDVPFIAPPLEPWMEELQSLDIEDASSPNGQIVWRPAQPVGRTLPSTFTAEDEVSTLPPLASLLPGMPVSRYFLNKRPDELVSSIRNTEDWPFLMHDPIFVNISLDCESVPITELISRRNKLFENHKAKPPTQTVNVENHEAEPEEPDVDEEYFDRQSQSGRSDESDGDGPRRVSRSPSAMSPGSREPSSHQGTNGAERFESHRAGDYLDDDASPLMEPRRESEVNYRSQTPDLSNRRSFSGEKRNHEQNGDRDHRPERSQNRGKNRGHSNKKKRNDRRNDNRNNFRGQDRKNRGSRGSAFSRPSGQKGRGFKNEHDSPSRDINSREEKERTNGHGEPTNGSRDHPSEKDQLKHVNRKRQRDESPEKPESNGPRRQEDDVAPKNKIRRPQVAAAYSRRW